MQAWKDEPSTEDKIATCDRKALKYRIKSLLNYQVLWTQSDQSSIKLKLQKRHDKHENY